MGNSRQFRAGRKAKVEHQKETIRRLTAQVGYLEGLSLGLAAQVEASKMERPADLEDWIDSVIPDLSDEERAEWDAMDEDERQSFIDALGQQVNVSKTLLDAAGNPSASG